MSTSPVTKATIVGLPAGVLLAVSGARPVQLLLVLAGAVLICVAWVRLERRAARSARATASQLRRDNSDRWRPPAPPRRLERRPTGRSARDVRCSSHPPRVRARARRSTRR